jgi:hypothetical protein
MDPNMSWRVNPIEEKETGQSLCLFYLYNVILQNHVFGFHYRSLHEPAS